MAEYPPFEIGSPDEEIPQLADSAVINNKIKLEDLVKMKTPLNKVGGKESFTEEEKQGEIRRRQQLQALNKRYQKGKITDRNYIHQARQIMSM